MEVFYRYLLAMFFLLSFLFLWQWIQKLAYKMADKYPQFGPAREEGGGCGDSVKCSSCCSNSENSCAANDSNHCESNLKFN